MANKKVKKQNEMKPKKDKKQLYTRILCFILAALMVGSSLFIILEILM